MSKSSPITRRIQNALYMKSALKQTTSPLKDDELDAEEAKGNTFSASDDYGKSVDVTTTTGLENRVKQIQDVDKKTYTYQDAREDGASEEEIAEMVKWNDKEYGTQNPTAEGLADNTYEVGKVDADGNPIMIDDPSGATEEVEVKKNVSKDKPTSYRRLTQEDAGKNYRGVKKAMNSEMKLRRKLGQYKGKKMSRKERLASTQIGQQILGTDGQGGMNFEIAGNMFQGGPRTTHERDWTSESDDSRVNRHHIDSDEEVKKNEKLNKKKKELLTEKEKGIGMTEASPLKGIFSGLHKSVSRKAGELVKGGKQVQKSFTDKVSDVKTSIKKGKDDMVVEYQKGAGTYVPPKPPKKKITKAEWTKRGTKLGKGRYGKIGEYDAKAHKAYNKNLNQPKGKPKGDKSGGKLDVSGDKKPWYKSGRALGSIAAVGGVSAYILNRGGTEITETDPPPVIPPNPVDPDPKTVDPPKVDPVPTTTTTTTTSNDRVTGASEGTLRKKTPGQTTLVGDRLSSSMRKFNERQAKKKARVKGKQERKDIRQAGKAKRKANRLAAKNVGGSTASFGGRTYDSSVNNMGNQFSQTKKNTKDWKSPGYKAV